MGQFQQQGWTLLAFNTSECSCGCYLRWYPDLICRNSRKERGNSVWTFCPWNYGHKVNNIAKTLINVIFNPLSETYWHLWCNLLNATPQKPSPTYPVVGTPEHILVCCPVQSTLNTSSFASAAVPWARFVMLCALTQYPALRHESNLPFSFFRALKGKKQSAGSSSAFLWMDKIFYLFLEMYIYLSCPFPFLVN